MQTAWEGEIKKCGCTINYDFPTLFFFFFFLFFLFLGIVPFSNGRGFCFHSITFHYIPAQAQARSARRRPRPFSSPLLASSSNDFRMIYVSLSLSIPYSWWCCSLSPPSSSSSPPCYLSVCFIVIHNKAFVRLKRDKKKEKEEERRERERERETHEHEQRRSYALCCDLRPFC